MKQALIIVAVVLAIATYAIFTKGLPFSLATAQGLSASFSWQGRGSDIITARLTQSNYTGTRPARVTYGAYWCKKTGTQDCAPDFSGDNKSNETLIFQDLDLTVPTGNAALNVVLPTVTPLRNKTCGRFQVDLGFKNGGGIIGGQVFSIGGDCPETPVEPVCPYLSTQAQVQKDSADPWADSKNITLGQSVNLGGFHNGTGRFAGDTVNNYSPNSPNVDFILTEPGGAASMTLTSPYPIHFTPAKVGTYTFIGRTRKEAGNPGAGYFNESGCTDTGYVTVNARTNPSSTPTPLPTVTPTPTPAPATSPTPTPTPIPGASTSPTPTPTSTGTNASPECVSLSATPSYGGAQLTTTLIGKGRDSDGIIRRMEYNFGDNAGSQTIDVSLGVTNSDTITSVTHTYAQAGEYTASLRVKDNSGQGNEWSSVPESCKVRINVQGQVLGTTTAYQPPILSGSKGLPKSGLSEWLTISYIIGAGGGIGFKVWANKLRSIR